MHIFICDDNKNEANICRELLLRYAEAKGMAFSVDIFNSGEALLFKLEDMQTQADLIYMDIGMPDIDGLQTTQKLRDMGFNGDIVFYTVRKEHVIDGYDLGALHFIIKKETTGKKFIEILERAIKNKEKREKEVMVFNCAGETRTIPLQEIKYFDIVTRIVTVHYGDDEFEFYSTMSKLEEQLFGKGFVRTHRSFLINEQYIAKVTSREVRLTSGEVFPAGRKYTDALINKG